ncbi:MAG: sulfur carrier protein ThiS [Rhodobacteraceae bacterium]|jgi:sulfur carrier protein|nr:sulfur carrier protein ThiS [Paracoccaceae bacterium]
MRIEVNGESRDVRSTTLSEALEELGFAGMKCATAVNAQFVPVPARAERTLKDGDRVEVLTPMQGG